MLSRLGFVMIDSLLILVVVSLGRCCMRVRNCLILVGLSMGFVSRWNFVM